MFNHEKATENGNEGMGGGSSLSRVDRVKGSGEGKVSSYSASPEPCPVPAHGRYSKILVG